MYPTVGSLASPRSGLRRGAIATNVSRHAHIDQSGATLLSSRIDNNFLEMTKTKGAVSFSGV